MLKIDKTSSGVYTANENIILLNQEAVDFLKLQAHEAPLQRARICAHRSNDDPIHEMLIALASDSYVRPHRHLGKSESFHVIEGCADIIIFKENGDIAQVIPLAKDGDFFFRISESLYHSMIIKSPYFVIHETTNGPFAPELSENAPFAPEESNKEQVKQYMASLNKIIDTQCKSKT